MTQEQPLSRAEVAEILHCPDEHISYLLITGQLFSLHRYNVEAYREWRDAYQRLAHDYAERLAPQFVRADEEFKRMFNASNPGPTEFISTPREPNLFYGFMAARLQEWELDTVAGNLLNEADRVAIEPGSPLEKILQRLPYGTFTREDIEKEDDGTISFKGLTASTFIRDEATPMTIESLDELMQKVKDAYWTPQQKEVFTHPVEPDKSSADFVIGRDGRVSQRENLADPVWVDPNEPIIAGGVLESPVSSSWVGLDHGPELIALPEGSQVYPNSDLANMFKLTKEQIGETLEQTTWQEDDLLVINIPQTQMSERP